VNTVLFVQDFIENNEKLEKYWNIGCFVGLVTRKEFVPDARVWNNLYSLSIIVEYLIIEIMFL
jgi:hypothetical protein